MDSGTVLAGRYQLRQVLGRGGIGEVWLGEDTSVPRREIAVKVLPSLPGEESMRRFEREAANLAKLKHPGITVVHDAGRHETCLFIVMELLHGQDLARLMAGHPSGMPVDRVVDLARQTVEALTAAHHHGVIHRDLKPANVFVQDGDRVKICDFGIARSLDASDAVTSTGLVLGAPAYMAPEQWQAQPLDARADLYALGAILSELLTGRPPFTANQSPYALMRRHVEEPAPRARSLRPDLPAWLDDVVAALLEKKPDDRPDAGALAATLDSATPAATPAQTQTATPGPTPADGTRPYTAAVHHGSTYPLRVTLRTICLALAFSPDGRTLATGDKKRVRIWDADTGEQVREIAGPRGFVTSLALSPDGHSLATVDNKDSKRVRLWDVRTGTHIRELAGHKGWLTVVGSVAFSPDGRLLASNANDKTVRIWDPQTGVERRQLRIGKQSGIPLAFSPDGRKLAANGTPMEVHVWDARTGQRLHTLSGHAGGVGPVAFSPDGRLLATSSGNHTVQIWDAHTGERLRGLTGHTGAFIVVRVAFSPDGRVLASAGDKTVRIWDPETGEQLHELVVHAPRVLSLAFAPDGRTLAAGDTEGLVHLWDVLA
jgi:eukaryotic-like serine/threonine-protein kinase